MFRKSILNVAVLTAMSVALTALGPGSASAGGYGSGYGNTYGKSSGHVGRTNHHPLPHVSDHIWKQHVEWCYGRFRSYTAYDNTYQPYSGPRQPCWSPFITG